jgi:hypothetical protein
MCNKKYQCSNKNSAVVSLQYQYTEENWKSSNVLKCLCPCSQLCGEKLDTALKENEND